MKTKAMATAILATFLLGCGDRPTAGAAEAAPQEVIHGTWSAHVREDGEPRLRLHRWSDDDDGWHNETSLPRTDARRIVEAARAGDELVEVTLDRPAGALALEGLIRNGRGRGEFTFREAPGFRGRMEELGLGRPDADEVFAAAVLDVGEERVSMLRDEGFRPDFDDVLATAIFGVDRPFIQEARRRWGDLELDDLMAMKIHGVTDAFVADLRALGIRLDDVDDALAFRIHGITPDFVREARGMGLGSLDEDDLVAMKIHGVDAAWLQGLADAGFPLDDLDDALSFRIHGVTPEWIGELREEGFQDLTADDLLKIRIHGLDRILRKRGG